jgi:archaemetzincin
LNDSPLEPAPMEPVFPRHSGQPLLLEIVPFERIDEVAGAVVSANLQEFFHVRTSLLPPRSLPPELHLPARDQYDAAGLIKELLPGLGSRIIRLGLTNRDLTLPILTYVFGESLVGGRVAVVSLFRLGTEPGQPRQDLGRLYERLVKVALHETSHALGLPHCRRPGCLMRFSYGLEQLDLLEIEFCPPCREEFRRLKKDFSNPLEFRSTGNRAPGDSSPGSGPGSQYLP